MESKAIAFGLAIVIMTVFSSCATSLDVSKNQETISGSQSETSTKSEVEPNINIPAQDVVKNFFNFKNKKNEEEIYSTLTEHWNAPNAVWGFDNLDYIKIINIEEEQDQKHYESYLKNGRGSVNRATINNLRVYKVRYEVKYKNDAKSPQESGTYDWWYFLIRNDQNSPWLIDDMGV